MKKSFTVLGQKVKIKFHKRVLELNGSLVYGYYDLDLKEIHIGHHFTYQSFLETIVHELGHSLCQRSGLRQTSLTKDIEEMVVDNYSKLIFELFKPQLEKWFPEKDFLKLYPPQK